MSYTKGTKNFIGALAPNRGINFLSEGNTTSLITANGTTIVYKNSSFIFGHKQEVQYFDVALEEATVRISCSGGAGGRGAWSGTNNDGAPGGYAEGTYLLPVGRYYVFVGNGNKYLSTYAGAGGGSSDVRTVYNNGTTFSRASFLETASLNSRICVGGGGGGSHGGAYGYWGMSGDQPGRGGPDRTVTNCSSTYDGGHVNTGADSTTYGLDGGASMDSRYTGNGAFGIGGTGTTATSYTHWGWPNGGAGTTFANGGGGGGWYGGAANWPNGGGGSNYLASYGGVSLISSVANSALEKNYIRYSETLRHDGLAFSPIAAQYNGGTSVPTYNASIVNPSGASGVLEFSTGTSASYSYWAFRISTNTLGGALTTGTYTFSFYARLSSGTSNLNNNQIWRNGASDTWSGAGWNPTFTSSWQRYSMTGPINASVATYLDMFLIHSGSLTPGYTIYLWGFQFEAGSTATPYVPSFDNGIVTLEVLS